MRWMQVACIGFIVCLTGSPRVAAGVPQPQDIGLFADPADSLPLGSRIPLILIHGWNSDQNRWDAFAKFVEDNKPFQAKFKIYRFGYPWDRPIEQNAEELKAALEEGDKFPPGTHVVIVAHSMGGLVARRYIEEQYKGWRGAELVDTLITLGTPHHGAPLANPAWLQNYSEVDALDPAIRHLAKKQNLNNPVEYGLGWDNFDRAMPADIWEGKRRWRRDIPPANRFTYTLNREFLKHPQYDTLRAKYIFYAGYYETVPFVEPDALALIAIADGNRAGSILTAHYFQDKDHQTVPNYLANDGVVPVTSALRLSPGDPYQCNEPIANYRRDGEVNIVGSRIRERAHQRYRLFPGVNHSQLPSDGRVLASVVRDLSQLSVWAWRGPRVTTPPEVGTPGMPSPDDLRGPIDLVFCIDATGSMRDDIEQVKKDAVPLVEELKKKSTSLRIGLVTYRDYAEDGSAHLDTNLPLTEDTHAIVAAIQGITVSGGGDTPEDVLDGLRAAIGMDWRDKVGKFIVLMGDAPPKLDGNGKDHAGNTLNSVAAAAEAVDPAHVYALTLSSSSATQEAFAKIAALTGGQAFEAAGVADLPTAILNTVEFAIKHSKEAMSTVSSSPPPAAVDWQLFALDGVSVGILVLALLNYQISRRKRLTPQQPEGEWLLFIHTEGQKGRTLPLYKTNLTVGRDPPNDVVVPDPNVAEWHLHVGYRNGKIAVSDLHGSKGFAMNGREVTMAYVKPNDRVTIGATTIVFHQRKFVRTK